MSAEHFFETARERYHIMLRRKNKEPAPWTDDQVLRDFYFCNVFREDDKTTAWLRKNIRNRLRSATPEHIVKAIAAFRWFNYIPTGELIKDTLVAKGWNAAAVRYLLRKEKQLWSGAYIIMPLPGQKVRKLDGVCQCMRKLDAKGVAKVAAETKSLELTHQKLMDSQGMGPFMAYEVISDLLHTKVLRKATDRYTWANPGPGCKRGLDWVYDKKHTMSKAGRLEMLNHMRELLALSQQACNWPEDWPAWDMRTVEHWLCEYDKYRRGQAGTHLKRRYRGGQSENG